MFNDIKTLWWTMGALVILFAAWTIQVEVRCKHIERRQAAMTEPEQKALAGWQTTPNEVKKILLNRPLVGIKVSNTDSSAWGMIVFTALIENGASRSSTDKADILISKAGKDAVVTVVDRFGNTFTPTDRSYASEFAALIVKTLTEERKTQLLHPEAQPELQPAAANPRPETRPYKLQEQPRLKR